MNPIRRTKSRATVCLAALTAAAATAALLAGPAHAVTGSGQATIVVADHTKGRTLSGQGVKLLAGAPATQKGRVLTLPISRVDFIDPGGIASTGGDGSLRFKRGKRSVTLSEIRLNAGEGVLSGKLAGEHLDVFMLGGSATVDRKAGSISLQEGRLQLTAEAAKALKTKLALEKALKRKGVGTVWLSAQAAPALAAPRPVVSGSADWGVLTSWRKYVLGNFGPGSVGTITTADGATANGTMTEAGAFFSFPAAGGSYRQGLYGAADKLSLKTAGAVIFAKPGHCIIEIKFSGLELTIDGANPGIALDSVSDIDTPVGMTCTDKPAVTASDAAFARLNLNGVTAVHSGNTVTWSAVPATLIAAGSTAWGAGPPYVEGKELDPVTISVGLQPQAVAVP